MARSRRLKAQGDAFYHISSRITGKQFLLQDPKIKNLMVSTLERAARFSGVKVGAYCIMDDHFHIIVHIPAVDVDKISECEILNRIEVLSGKKKAEYCQKRWARLLASQDISTLEAEYSRWRRRMSDLSQFVKTFKEEFRRGFNREHEYSGRLWGDRFFSSLMESEEYFSICRAYVETNPLRAGLASEIDEYPWSTLGAAAHGSPFARECCEWMISLGYDFAGDTPQGMEWLRKRWPQISKGKLLGSCEFVTEAVSKYKQALFSHTLRAREVIGGVYASHGYKIERALRKKGIV